MGLLISSATAQSQTTPIAALLPIIDQLPAQEQASRLLQSAIQGEKGALAAIETRVPTWFGRIGNWTQLQYKVSAALNASDLEVRVAAVEITLAAHKIAKTPAEALAPD